MKNFINGFGTCFAFMCAVLLAIFMYLSYPTEMGYTKETRARMDDLVAQLTPLTTADLGEF